MYWNIQWNLHVRPPPSHKATANPNTKIFPVKTLQLEPLVNDHLL